MSEPSGSGGGGGGSWEARAAGLANEVQRWLIRTSAKNMRDEVSGQVKKALRGPEVDPGDVWSTATTEPPRSSTEAPECAWCPVCRAARRVSEARAAGGEGRGAAALSEVSDVLTGAVREVLAGLDSVLSYRPGDFSTDKPEAGKPGAGRTAPTASAPERSAGEAAASAPAPGAGEPLAEEDAAADPAGAPIVDRVEEPEDEPGDRG